jgi:hypothetical protein
MAQPRDLLDGVGAPGSAQEASLDERDDLVAEERLPRERLHEHLLETTTTNNLERRPKPALKSWVLISLFQGGARPRLPGQNGSPSASRRPGRGSHRHG